VQVGESEFEESEWQGVVSALTSFCCDWGPDVWNM
jgi:hypothetical protein